MRLILICLFTLASAVVWAQDVIINANTTQNSVMKVTNTATSAIAYPGKPAIWGVSVPTVTSGIGVKAEGGVYGVHASASSGSSPNNRTGVLAEASQGYYVYGVSSSTGAATYKSYAGYFSTGSNSVPYKYGIYAYTYGGTYNYGIWSSAGGGSYNYAGYFSGDVYTTGSYLPSDSVLKSDIQPMPTVLDKLMSFKVKTYKMRTDKFSTMNLPKGQQNGLLAQEVAGVFPDLVTEVPFPDEEKGKSGSETFKAVNYTGLVPVLIKAIQEQQDQIVSLQAQIEDLRKKKADK